MQRIFRTAAALAMAMIASAAFAHAKLQKSEPANGTTVTASPSALKLHYNEAVEPAMSRVKIIGPAAAGVQTGKPMLADGDDKTLVVPVSKLPPGDYRFEWSTTGHDGHPMKGEVRFTVK